MNEDILSNILTEGPTEKFIQQINVLSAAVKAILIVPYIICALKTLLLRWGDTKNSTQESGLGCLQTFICLLLT